MSRYPGCPLFGPSEMKGRSVAYGGRRPPDDLRGVPAQGSAGSPPSWESAATGRSNGWVALAGRRIRRLTYTKITPVYQFFYRKEPLVFDTFGQIAGHGGQAQSWTKHNDFWRWPEVVPALRPQDDCKVARELGSVSPELIEGQAERIRRWFDKSSPPTNSLGLCNRPALTKETKTISLLVVFTSQCDLRLSLHAADVVPLPPPRPGRAGRRRSGCGGPSRGRARPADHAPNG